MDLETVSRSSLAHLEPELKFEVDTTCGGKLYNIALARLDSRPLWQYEIASPRVVLKGGNLCTSRPIQIL
jgi:hypothetical protein